MLKERTLTLYKPAATFVYRLFHLWDIQTKRRKKLLILFSLSLSLSLLMFTPIEVQQAVQNTVNEASRNNPVLKSLERVYPLLFRFPMTSGYGMRVHPVLGILRLHDGRDYGTPTGTPVLSPVDGKVIQAGGTKGSDGPFTGYGLLVEVEYGDKETLFFAHLDQIFVRVGQQVKVGQQLALSGGSGLGTGEHLHVGASRNGASINPDFIERFPLISAVATSNPTPPSQTEINDDDYFKGVIALVNTIYTTEGTYYRDNPYNTQYTGKQFQEFKDHPFVNRQSSDGIDYVKPLPCGQTQAGPVCSAASGAGQWMPKTWLEVERSCPLLKENKDPNRFSPARQDLAMVCLLQRYGFFKRAFRNASVKNNRIVLYKEAFSQAIYSISGEWASLPTNANDELGAHDQGAKGIDEVWKIYNKRLAEVYQNR